MGLFEPAMDLGSIAQRLLVESDLRRAIHDNQLVLHYQPQVNCHTGVVTGVEALVRWQHPQRGSLMPIRQAQGLSAARLSTGGWPRERP